MSTQTIDINTIENVRRFENFGKDRMNGLCMEMTHAVYPHDEIYGNFCTLQAHVECPAEDIFEYLATPYTLAEWTYSMRDFGEPDANGVVESTDKIGGETKIYTKVVANRDALTAGFGATAEAAFLADSSLDPFFDAVIEATEEAILNALVANADMTGRDGNFVPAIPRDRLAALFA